MKTHPITTFLFVVCVAFSGARALGQNKIVVASDVDPYKDCSQVEILRFKDLDTVGHIFAFADDKYFTEATLRSLFQCLSKPNSRVTLLTITLFSDKENLGIAIRNLDYPPSDVNPPENTSAHDCKDLKHAVRPCPLGYYRAIYFRFDGREFFDYSKNPALEPMTRVNLISRRSTKHKH